MRTLDSTTSLRIAVQKSGRLTDKTLNLLEGIGLKFDDYKRSLLVKCLNFDVELLLIRDDDIPEYVQDGVCDLGFVGANVVEEDQMDVEILRGLNYGVCRLSLAVPKDGDIKKPEDFAGKKIATSYPGITKRYFEKKGIDVKVITLSGSVEIAPRLEIADAICDLVSTGNTLKANGLDELINIFDSETQLIKTNKPLSEGKQQLIEKILQRIEGYQKAGKSRYIMMNAPQESVERIKEIIPSLKSPTVMPLADNGMVAIHTVVPLSTFWDVMERLKEAGATGIVMLPIESMIA
ncbi:ATP phosphoribosyltransferase [Rhodohalobacter sulfatireducens]|uniref:ATP phosphoribosyltransferase n=1 Tax=Rhodohalobacter sulfatireducens TaxID=2911366 RepID=A0ABS9K9C4_9BACT|nr:ATP phosphoribosyltransferase [Rhodohalobacter sulfatireducens]MCG2587408.1 ATP phosphoribosyltransferase [Rhodohalobacter sulfatireducens]